MSFVNLATLTMHRRNEMESRIQVLNRNCERAISDIKNMQSQAQNFLSQLNCEPAELKERFLTHMRKIDEYMYLITDLNLAIGQLEKTGNDQFTPVQDSASILLPTCNFNPIIGSSNLMDALSEPTLSTSMACRNQCPPEKPNRVKSQKADQLLIAFSSASSSSESVRSRETESMSREVLQSHTELEQELSSIRLEDAASPEPCQLPEQIVLDQGHSYYCTIISLDGTFIWVFTESPEEVQRFMQEMTEYYKENQVSLTTEHFKKFNHCAYYDEESDCFYRALFVKEEAEDKVELFLVDTGELYHASIRDIQPLHKRFCTRPPYARCCELAGFDVYNNKTNMKMRETTLKDFLGLRVTIEIEDNTSESLSAYVKIPESGVTLNSILVYKGLAVSTDSRTKEMQLIPPFDYPEHSGERVNAGDVRCRSREDVDRDIDIAAGPEYEDPVEAVTGYHNRDEADICPHYKGGPEKTCFKGLRCKKRHVRKHPDGWTLDRVEVAAKCPVMPLPALGSYLTVLVTHVAHYDRVFAQIVDPHRKANSLPKFDTILPPMTVESLGRDMNSPATINSYKQLRLTPALGELVAALYPPDNCWYRAKVVTTTPGDENIQVAYIDYGTEAWVTEDMLRELEPRLCALPAQAVSCALAGVTMSTCNSQKWAAAMQALADVLINSTFTCHVIARSYTELTVELFDDNGVNIAEDMAERGLFELFEYGDVIDNNVAQKLVVP